MYKKDKKARKELLKKIIKGHQKDGKSFTKLDGGLGNLSSAPSGDEITGGAGSNLGINGIF